MCMHEQWWLHCVHQWGQYTPLSEHVYCETTAFEMSEQVEQQICIKFWVTLEHSSAETLDESEGCSWGQLVTGSFIMTMCLLMHHVSCRVFWWDTKSLRWLSPLYSPNLAPCDFWLFPKLKSPLEGKRFRQSMRFRKIQWGGWWRLGELCEVPRCLLWRGLRRHCPMYNVSCTLFNKCLYFSYNMAGNLDRPHMILIRNI